MSVSTSPEGKLHFPTLVISDVHLGKGVAKADLLLEFLQNVTCDRLIINGDLIDGWRLMAKKHTKLPEMHIHVLDRINEMAALGTEVVYIAGNHDENLRANWDREARTIREPGRKRPPSFLDRDIEFYDPNQDSRFSIKVCDTLDYTDPQGRKVHFFHGDQLEPKILKTKIGRAISMKGDGFYDAFVNMDDSRAQRMAKVQNSLEKKGKHFSLAKFAKKAAKGSFGINKAFRKAASKVEEKGYQGVGVGHNHDPYIRDDKDGLYLNSGDWVEHCTALTHDEDGNWRLLQWKDMRKELGFGKIPNKKDKNPSAAYRSITQKQLRALQWIWPAKDTVKRRAKMLETKRKIRALRSKLVESERALVTQAREFDLY